jgi:hypothetical protein
LHSNDIDVAFGCIAVQESTTNRRAISPSAFGDRFNTAARRDFAHVPPVLATAGFPRIPRHASCA